LAELDSTRYPAAFCAAALGANGVFAIEMKAIAIKAAPATRASQAEAAVAPGDPERIPTLSEWAMLLMAMLLAAIGGAALRQRRRN